MQRLRPLRTGCHEGAIGIIDGKAKLLRDDYCDGLGNCLPACPAGAIGFEEREAAEFDEEAVKAHIAKKAQAEAHKGCPGSRAMSLEKKEKPQVKEAEQENTRPESRLSQSSGLFRSSWFLSTLRIFIKRTCLFPRTARRLPLEIFTTGS
jgi:Fe-S-cluster-containing hydrogenase component 2